MKRLFLIGIIISFLYACAPGFQNQIQYTLNSWIGTTEEQLSIGWGVPDRKTQITDKVTAYEYYRNRKSESETIPLLGLLTVTEHKTSMDRWTFFISNGKVVNARFDNIRQ